MNIEPYIKFNDCHEFVVSYCNVSDTLPYYHQYYYVMMKLR